MAISKVSASVALVALLAGCAHKRHARAVAPAAPSAAYTETGLASWYGRPYHGRPAANGEIYDMETLVAAHRTLPFNTWLRVFDLDNGKSVEVRIIDRGPFAEGRIIDLSHAAARAIEMIGPGTARVRLEVIRWAEAAPGVFAVQVGAFRNRANAERLREGMAARYGTASVVERAEEPGTWRVMVGSEPTEDGARALAGRIRSESGERNAFVVRLN